MEIGAINKNKVVSLESSDIDFSTASIHFELDYYWIKISVIDAKSQEILAFECFPIDDPVNQLSSDVFDEIVSASNLPIEKFNNAVVAVVTNKFTLLPKVLYDKNNRNLYLEKSTSFDESKEVAAANSISNIDIKAVYAIPKNVVNFFRSKFDKVKWLWHGTSSITGVLSSLKSSSDHSLIINIHSGYYDLIFFDKRNLEFCVVFPVQTTEDFLYNLMFTIEQQKIDTNKVETLIVGEVEKNSALFDIIFKYVKNAKWPLNDPKYLLKGPVAELNPYFYFSLFNQYQCV